MNSKEIFQKEWGNGWKAFNDGEILSAKIAFENAHYQGQFSVIHHFLAHYAKFCLAKKEKKWFLCLVQPILMTLAPISPINYVFYKIKFFLPMLPELKACFENEIDEAYQCYRNREFNLAMQHIGKAHILGSHFSIPHFRTHFLMLLIEIKKGNYKGCIVQITRTLGALGTRFLVHFFGVTGNPGWSEYPIGSRLKIDDDLKFLLDKQGLK